MDLGYNNKKNKIHFGHIEENIEVYWLQY